MKEFATRAISGILYVVLLIASMYWQNALLVLLALFGIISLAEFSKLIHLKSFIQYIIFICLYFGFWYWCMKYNNIQGTNEAIQILLVITAVSYTHLTLPTKA